MISELSNTLLLIFLWSAGGVIPRILWELYCVKENYAIFSPDWLHIGFDALASFVFGTIGVLFLIDIGILHSKGVLFGPEAVASVGGFFGSLLLKKIAKWAGIEMPRFVNLSLPGRQSKAIEFVRKYKSITNNEYQQLAKISDSTATRDLEELVRKRVLRKVGDNKATRYEGTQNG